VTCVCAAVHCADEILLFATNLPRLVRNPSDSAFHSVPMSRWIPLAKVTDCPPGQGIELVAEDRIVALYNVDGDFYAIDGVCPHQGGPLGKGQLEGCVVTCPWHGWQFDVRDGQHQLNARMRQPRFDVRVENDIVMIDLGEQA
jgi:nitrite reductase (NADH) small subunit